MTFNFTWSFHLDSSFITTLAVTFNFTWIFHLDSSFIKTLAWTFNFTMEFSLESKPYRCGKDGFYIENTNIFTSIYFKSSLEQEFDQS